MSQDGLRKDHRVVFRRPAQWNDVKWYEGIIIRTNYDRNGVVKSYAVQEFEPMCERRDTHKINSPGDFFSIRSGPENIRILPYERCCTGRLHDAMNAHPILKDPYAHLYMGVGRFKMPSNKEIEGLIEKRNLMIMVRIVSYRRRIVEGTIAPYHIAGTPLEILESILPKERDLVRLRELAQEDSFVMLQLADVYRFGLLGTEPDYSKAAMFYECAANGMTEQEYNAQRTYEWKKFAYPMGNPEALTAQAYEDWKYFIDKWKGAHKYYEEGPDDFDSILSTQADFSGQQMLIRITARLSHAIRRGWTSPFSLRFAKAVSKNINLLHYLYPYSVQLENSVDCSEKRYQNTKHQEAVLSAYQMKCFTPNANKIFLDLPIKMTHGSNQDSTDIHIEYRETISSPKQMVVIVANPQGNHCTLEFLDEFKYTPFTKEAYEYVWARVVFTLHQGDFWNGERFRPSLITFGDHPMDKLLALNVKLRLNDGNCGTKLDVINPLTYLVKFGDEMLPIEKVIGSFEVATAMKEKKSSPNFNHIWKAIEEKQTHRRFNSQSMLEPESEKTHLSNTNKLNRKGCDLYKQGRFQAAWRCYTDAINIIQSDVRINTDIANSLGRLLNNRASCLFKMSEGKSLGSATTALKNGIKDCKAALENIRFLRPKLRSLIEKNMDRINTRLSKLAMVPIHTETQAPPSRRGKRKTKKKRQRRQRSSQRQQHRPKEEKPEKPKSKEREDDLDLISIATGNKLMESKITSFVARSDDVCPCCVDRFSVELDDVFCAVNPCGHAYCLPCLSVLLKKSKKGSNPLGFNCPVCRVPLQKDILSDAVIPIVSCIPCLQQRIASLPLNGTEGMQVVKELCLRHDFKIPNVLSALDSMLTDGLQASLRSSKNLSHAQKQEIYETAREPVDVLWAEAKKLRSQMDRARDWESKTYLQWKNRLMELQTTLIPSATKNAVDFIWEKMNSAGSMGIESISGEIEIDFHALHVHEARERFHERVLPILPAVKSVLLVVGRGNHSDGGNAKLKPALKKIIDNHSKMRFNHVEGNEGMIRVRWLH